MASGACVDGSNIVSGCVATAPFREGWLIHESSSGRIFQLNETAALAWFALRSGEDTEAVIDRLEYSKGIDRTILRHDLRTFVEALTLAGLLPPKGADQPTRAAAGPLPSQKPALRACYCVGDVTVEVACYAKSVADRSSILRPLSGWRAASSPNCV